MKTMRVFMAKFYHESEGKLLILTISDHKCLQWWRTAVKLLDRRLTGGLPTQEIDESKELSFYCIPLIYELLKQ